MPLQGLLKHTWIDSNPQISDSAGLGWGPQICIFFFFVFLPFLGLLPWYMEVPSLEVYLEL